MLLIPRTLHRSGCMTSKAAPEDLSGRIREIRSDPCNERIARVEHAGETVDGHFVMHNGLLVKPMCRGYMKLLEANAGCHEPQEEYVFQEVLKHIPSGGCIVELGAYWGFYSMWFAKAVAQARCYLVEPSRKNLKTGQYNFRKNGLEGNFFHSKIGHEYLGVDRFLDKQMIRFVDVLHADIQGAELEMLEDAEDSLNRGRIGCLFVGTHSQDLHYRCKAFLEERGYIVIAHADFDHGTYCCDGVLVVRHKDVAGPEPIDLPLRQPHQPYDIEKAANRSIHDAHATGGHRPLGFARTIERRIKSLVFPFYKA